jgi:ribosomal-protein-alanine N-acetyltransferase
MTFRPLNPNEKEIVKSFLGDIFERDFDDSFFSENNNPTVLEINGQIIGFLSYFYILDEAELFLITVKKEFQGLGYGKILLEHLLNKLKENNVKVCYLEVSSKNSRAINLYKKFGFYEYSYRKKYYSNSDDAILMKKEL